MSVSFPALSFYAALFFFVKYYVDKSNFKRNAFALTPDMDFMLEVKVFGELFNMVFFFWFMVSMYIYAQKPTDHVVGFRKFVFDGDTFDISSIQTGFTQSIPTPFETVSQKLVYLCCNTFG